ncbi:MAG TPA: hypothetical protein VLX90_23130 [Steroidobacteraceae bacterium]|nr:hypothetical protein [Steroidobacteraceae bacterium]
MKPKDWRFAPSADRYQLHLQLVSSTSPRGPLWDRSGAGRKFALRAAVIARAEDAQRAAGITRH